MQWIGAALILSVTTWIGFDVASKFKKRPSHIRQWKNALQMIEAEMVYGQSSLYEVCRSISRNLPAPIHYFFTDIVQDTEPCPDFSELWTAKLNSHWPLNALTKSELEILTQFGKTLGQHDLIQQQKQIQLTLHHLDRELNDALEVCDQYQRLARGIGVLSGVLVIILIM
ncbi:stage III sporulation protein SpoIIIAB [Halobacillus salinarum]|uniref:Stage III sporulation protein SpoIIIAB n=1 Tax=Halobacillus salinarum TaxID=2932257 RepID=A0ABY4EES2_9BACI|nr:stage III sporulation protein SpoIIIAB [Halobacillus salinarum]UOQ42553.1 stage III sporulation protein SpoIIIAB [Halobacillus salinarum]